jgi:hypothetical protein
MNTIVLAVPSFCLLLAGAPAQDGVRIVKVPDVVRLPAAHGSNLLLEVEVDGAASEVWIASDLASRDRVALSPAGERRHQLNLADPRIAAMLPAGRDDGELAVFAKVGSGTVRSAAIAWSRATAPDAKVRCLVRSKGGTTAFVEQGASAWLDPATVERVELQGAGARQSSAVARVGEIELPLVRRAEQGIWVLEGGAALRERLQDEGTFEVEARLGGSSAVFGFAVVPGKLPLRDGRAQFVVQQRKSAAVPGSNGWLIVRLDDITMGGVLLDVETATGTVVVPQQIVHEREAVEFALADERYVLVIEKLVNLLIGEDHAELRVERAAGFRPDRIGQLVRAVGASEDVFLREGKEYAGPLAMQFLIARLGSVRGPGPTVDEFVDTFASKSSRTGEPYHVRRKDGTTVTMQEWLQAARRELEAKEKAAAAKR